MNSYSHVQNFSLYGDREKIMKVVKEFNELGWDIIGEVAILSIPFYAVAWPRENGEPIYPSSYQTQG